MRPIWPEDGVKYIKAMRAAKQEFADWEQNKRRTRKLSKEKYKAQRLAKLAMMELMARDEM